MREVELVLILLAAVAVLVSISARLSIPYPILLVLGGLVLGFVPGLPVVQLDPHVVFVLFLPPLLYWDAASTSWRDFRAGIRTISLLAIGLVVATTLGVGALAHSALHLSWAAALTLGAVVSSTDPVAASSVMKRMGVPPKVITIVQDESLINDATALVVFASTIEILKTGEFSLGRASLEFVFVAVGGVLVGLAAGWVVHQLQHQIDEALVSGVLRLMTPFVVYILAESVHVSGILAVVVTGLYSGRKASTELTSEERLESAMIWQMVTFIINGLVFILIGLQFRSILDAIDDRSTSSLIRDALLISFAVIAVRMVWVYLAGGAIRLLPPSLTGREEELDVREMTIVGWSGMRGVVALATALSMPWVTSSGIISERPLIQFLTFAVILVTLVGQGLTLPMIISALGITRGDRSAREEQRAREAMTRAALGQLDRLSRDAAGSEMYGMLHRYYRNQLTRNGSSSVPGDESWVQDVRDVRRDLLDVEHQTLVNLRDQEVISYAVLHRLERELDIEAMHLDARVI
jgi:CPA1 family monovalent cation:H+ antiporter